MKPNGYLVELIQTSGTECMKHDRVYGGSVAECKYLRYYMYTCDPQNIMTTLMVTNANTFTKYGISQMTLRSPYYSVKMIAKIMANLMILFKFLGERHVACLQVIQ